MRMKGYKNRKYIGKGRKSEWKYTGEKCGKVERKKNRRRGGDWTSGAD